MLRLNIAYNLTGPLIKMFHEPFGVRQSYRLLMHGEANDGEDFHKSCPWYFTFKSLDTGPRSPPAKNMTLRELSISERNSASGREEVVERRDDSTFVGLSAKVVNPFLNLRPMPKRPAFLASPPPATPTLPGIEQGQSKQVPIEIDSDSDSSSIVEIIDLPISKPRKSTKKVKATIPVD